MVELGLRLLISGAVLCSAGNFSWLPWPIAWKVSVAQAILAIGLYQFETRKGVHTGARGLFAVGDAFLFATLLAGVHQLETLGFLTLAPCVYAIARYGTRTAPVACLSAVSLIAAHYAVTGTLQPTPTILMQAVGVLMMGLMQLLRPAPVEAVSELEQLQADGHLQLRESYRKLRDAYRDLERRSRRDRISSELAEVRQYQGEEFYSRLTAKLQGLTGAANLALYTVAQSGSAMSIRAVVGAFPEIASNRLLAIDLSQAIGRVNHRLEKDIEAVLTEERQTQVANVLLIDRSQVHGMLCITDCDGQRIQELRTVGEELAPFVSAMIAEEIAREAINRKLVATEILYEVTSLGKESRNPRELGAKITQEIKNAMNVEHVALYSLEGEDLERLSSQGTDAALIEGMAFENGKGVRGWLDSGSPEIFIPDVRNAQGLENLKTGSFSLIPLQKLRKVFGFLTVAARRTDGIGPDHLETLRSVAREFADTLYKLDGEDGQMTAREFSNRVRNAKHGFLVYLDPIRRFHANAQDTEELEKAYRRFAKRVHAMAPVGGGLYRRPEGDFVVYLPLDSADKATRWANDATATAAMIPVKSPDGRKIPLAMRAKVANLNPQENEVIRRLQLSVKQSGTFAR